jgi:hypothetical protein
MWIPAFAGMTGNELPLSPSLIKEGELKGYVVPCPYTMSIMIREYNNSDTVLEEVS